MKYSFFLLIICFSYYSAVSQSTNVKTLKIDCIKKKLIEGANNTVVTSLSDKDAIKIVPADNCSSCEFEISFDGEDAKPYTQGGKIFLNGKESLKLNILCSNEAEKSSDPVEIKHSPASNSAINLVSSYDRKQNIAHFVFDQNGILIGRTPVNIDADDIIMVSIVAPASQIPNFSMDIQGDYSPVDLNIRPGSWPEGTTKQSMGEEDDPITVTTREFGPFTSEKVTLTISKTGEESLVKSIKINPLYHVALGASFLVTKVPKPEFDVFPLNGTSENTIDTFNTGARPIATLDVIFYWKSSVDWLTGKLRRNSNITRGRDILKEPTFWERLNPTFSVSIDKGWRENFFFGGMFEFARGGSISAGWHYGKVSNLADPNFILGKTPFTGTKNDIKLGDHWEWGSYFGITLDTRIFNSIFNRN